MNYWDIINIFFILAILLGIMYGLLYLMKKFLYPQKTKTGNAVNINVLSTQILLPKKYLSVVKVKDKIYLLGISENSVNLIDKLEDDGSFDFTDHNNFASVNFKDIFKKISKSK